MSDSNRDYAAEGYDAIECSQCMEFKWRKYYGESPNGKRKYYQDEKKRSWRGKICPDCSRKNHTKYMKKYRSKDNVVSKQDPVLSLRGNEKAVRD